jgi:D-lyxose ketol-isomerase
MRPRHWHKQEDECWWRAAAASWRVCRLFCRRANGHHFTDTPVTLQVTDTRKVGKAWSMRCSATPTAIA